MDATSSAHSSKESSRQPALGRLGAPVFYYLESRLSQKAIFSFFMHTRTQPSLRRPNRGLWGRHGTGGLARGRSEGRRGLSRAPRRLAGITAAHPWRPVRRPDGDSWTFHGGGGCPRVAYDLCACSGCRIAIVEVNNEVIFRWGQPGKATARPQQQHTNTAAGDRSAETAST